MAVMRRGPSPPAARASTFAFSSDTITIGAGRHSALATRLRTAINAIAERDYAASNSTTYWP
jgi:hypothetical protein